MPWACAACAPSITARPRTAPRIVLFMEISSQRVGCWKAREASGHPARVAGKRPATGCFNQEARCQQSVVLELVGSILGGLTTFTASIPGRLRPAAPRGARRHGEPQELGRPGTAVPAIPAVIQAAIG